MCALCAPPTRPDARRESAYPSRAGGVFSAGIVSAMLGHHQGCSISTRRLQRPPALGRGGGVCHQQPRLPASFVQVTRP